jgi:hypothetical protein
VTTMVDEPTNNAGRMTFRKIQAKAKRIIFDSVKDNIMLEMTSLMTAKDCMKNRLQVRRGHLITSLSI